MDRAQSDVSGLIIAIVVAVVIGATMLGVVLDTTSANTGTQSVTNESLTESASLGETYELEGYEVVSGSETVWFENGSAGSFEQATAGTDYTVDQMPGDVTLEESGEIDAGDEVKVSYDWEATDSTTTTILDLLGLFIALILLVFVARPLMLRA